MGGLDDFGGDEVVEEFAFFGEAEAVMGVFEEALDGEGLEGAEGGFGEVWKFGEVDAVHEAEADGEEFVEVVWEWEAFFEVFGVGVVCESCVPFFEVADVAETGA